MKVNFYASDGGFKDELICAINFSIVPEKGDIIKLNNTTYYVIKRCFYIKNNEIEFIEVFLTKKH